MICSREVDMKPLNTCFTKTDKFYNENKFESR